MLVSWYECNHSQTILLAGILCHTFPKPNLQLLHSFLSFGFWILLGYPCLTETNKYNWTYFCYQLTAPMSLNIHTKKWIYFCFHIHMLWQNESKILCKTETYVNNLKTGLLHKCNSLIRKDKILVFTNQPSYYFDFEV